MPVLTAGAHDLARLTDSCPYTAYRLYIDEVGNAGMRVRDPDDENDRFLSLTGIAIESGHLTSYAQKGTYAASLLDVFSGSYGLIKRLSSVSLMILVAVQHLEAALALEKGDVLLKA